MGRKAVVLAVFCLLVFAGGARAVTLQQGWYANIEPVYVFGPGQSGLVDAVFTTPVGTYWPFSVTNGGYPSNVARFASVQATSGAGPAQSLTLPVYIPLGQGTPIDDYLVLSVSTNYDAASMYVSLWHDHPGVSHSLLWEQKLSGQRIWSGYVPFDSAVDDGQTYFRIEVAPEPAGLACLLMGAWTLAGVAVARRHLRASA